MLVHAGVDRYQAAAPHGLKNARSENLWDAAPQTSHGYAPSPKVGTLILTAASL